MQKVALLLLITLVYILTFTSKVEAADADNSPFVFNQPQVNCPMNTTVTLSWTEGKYHPSIGDSRGYYLIHKTGFETINVGKMTSYVDHEVSPNQTYTYTIETVTPGSAKPQLYSDQRTVITTCHNTYAVSLEASTTGCQSGFPVARLAWEGPRDSYDIWRTDTRKAENDNSRTILLYKLGAMAPPYFEDRSVEGGVMYEYKVDALQADVSSSPYKLTTPYCNTNGASPNPINCLRGELHSCPTGYYCDKACWHGEFQCQTENGTCFPGSEITSKGDGNKDGVVNIYDFNLLISHFNQVSGNYEALDFDNNGQINIFDFNQFVSRGFR